MYPGVALENLLRTMIPSAAVTDAAGILLAGGLGRRMLPISSTIPKPLVPVLDCPLLGWGIDLLASSGIRDIGINVHHLPEQFSAVRSICAQAQVDVHVCRESTLSGPFGGLLSCVPLLPQVRDFIVFATDALYDVDVEALIDTHRMHGAQLTFGIASVADGASFGVLDVDNLGRAHGMTEKPPGIGPVGTASCGVYVVSRSLIEEFPKTRCGQLDWIDVAKEMFVQGRPVMTFPVAEWRDVTSPIDLLSLNLSVLRDEDLMTRVANPVVRSVNSTVWSVSGKSPPEKEPCFTDTCLLGDDVHIGTGCNIQGSIIGSGAWIEDGALLDGCLVLPGAVVDKDSRLSKRIVWRNTDDSCKFF